MSRMSPPSPSARRTARGAGAAALCALVGVLAIGLWWLDAAWPERAPLAAVSSAEVDTRALRVPVVPAMDLALSPPRAKKRIVPHVAPTVASRHAASIRGRVSWRDGTPAPADTVVAAWPDGSPPELHAAQDALSSGDLVRTTVAADGSFVLAGLQAGKRYAVVAAGPSVIGPRVVRAVADTEDVRVTVLQRLALLVELVDTHGFLLQSDAETPSAEFG